MKIKQFFRYKDKIHGHTYRLLLCYSTTNGINIIRRITNKHPKYTDADPFKIITVDPRNITHYSEKKWPVIWGATKQGDWDRPTDSFTEREIYKGLHEHVKQNNSQRLSEAIQSRIDRGTRPVWGYSSPEEVDKRISDIDELISSLQSQGYQTQRQLHKDNQNWKGWKGTYYYPPIVNEVTVAIGRDGELYYVYFGQHRLALAQILNIETIPVIVGVRHRKWQSIRDTVRKSQDV